MASPLESEQPTMWSGPLAQIRRARAEGLRPDLLMLVADWADANRILPKKSSAEPGPWRTSRTPYLREIMDGLSSLSPIEEIVFMKGSQIGGTEAILNALGYVIDHSPGPVIFIQPTVELAKRFSRQRVDPLIRTTPRIAAKVAPARERDSGNTMLSKEFAGGQLVITGANSAVGLRSMPAQYAFMDEIDGWPVDVDEEGSPIALVEARQRTFIRKKRAKVSTPTIAGRSAIEAAYNDSDQRRYYVPCPDCGEMQPLEFERLKWTEFGREPMDAVYECRSCLYQIRNHQKTALLARGEWRMEAPQNADGKTRGYHLNALYSPVGWMSWGEIAVDFVKAQGDQEKLRVFINTVLGQVWKSRGEAPEWDLLMARRETYAFRTAPMGVLFLTCGVDVQKDRVVYEVVGWGRDKRSWSIDYGEIAGDTSSLEDGPWTQVDALLARTFPHETGLQLSIVALCVDSGYNTQTVYSWAKTYPMNRVFAIKGHDYGGALVGSPTPVEVLVNGKKSKRGGRVWPVVGTIAKSELYGALAMKADGPGFCRFPQYAEEYFKQLTAEQLVSHKTRKGYIRMEWEVIPGRQNHVLDARVYARAGAALAGLDRFTDSDWKRLEKALGVQPTEPVSSVAPVVAGQAVEMPRHAQPPAAIPRRPGWVRPQPGGWLKRK